MVSRSRTVMAARFSLTVAGSVSGKKEMTLSVSFSLPSEAAKMCIRDRVYDKLTKAGIGAKALERVLRKLCLLYTSPQWSV